MNLRRSWELQQPSEVFFLRSCSLQALVVCPTAATDAFFFSRALFLKSHVELAFYPRGAKYPIFQVSDPQNPGILLGLQEPETSHNEYLSPLHSTRCNVELLREALAQLREATDVWGSLARRYS